MSAFSTLLVDTCAYIRLDIIIIIKSSLKLLTSSHLFFVSGALSAGSIVGIVIGCLVLVAAICGGIAAIFVLRGRSTGRFSFGQKDTTGIVNEDSLQ